MLLKGSRYFKNTNRWVIAVALLAVAGLSWTLLRHVSQPFSSLASIHPQSAAASTGTRVVTPEEQSQILTNFGNLPLAFEPNLGQTDPEVKYLSHSPRYNLFLTANEAVFTLPIASPEKPGRNSGQIQHPRPLQQSVLRLAMKGANPAPAVQAETQIGGHSNYMIGNDHSKWVRGVEQFARVNYHAIYPGVDLTFYGRQGQLEFDFIVHPGAEPQKIALGVNGTKKLQTNAAGDLVLTSAGGDLVLHKPVAYQKQGDARQPVDASFVRKGSEIAFALGPYDHSRDLVIDPSFVYSTYLGGGNMDEGFAIAVQQNCPTAGQCDAFITGETASPGFPTKNPSQQHLGGSGVTNAFVTRLNALGTGLVYSTFLGGSGTGSNTTDSGNAIAVDAAGNAYVVGTAESQTTFPLFGAEQATFGGGTQDAFVAKFDPTGVLVYSTFLGGSGDDIGLGVAVDNTGAFYVTGKTTSTNFPLGITTALQGVPGGTSGDIDAFVSKYDPTGATLLYSSYIGGSGIDAGNGIAVDATHNIYVGGLTFSSDLFTKSGATGGLETTCASCSTTSDHGFIAVINANLSSYKYFTYVSGSGTGNDEGFGIAVDSASNAYLVGQTTSTNFPTKNAYQSGLASGGTSSAFITGINAAGNGRVYSTYFGGNSDTAALGVAVGSTGKVYVTGTTSSTSLPTTSNVPQTTAGGGIDTFIAEFDPTASGSGSLVISTYLGGTKDEDSSKLGGIAVDSQGNMYVAGETLSNYPADLFPIIPGSFQTANGSSHDAFVSKLSPTTVAAQFNVAVSAVTPSTISKGSTGTATVTVTSTGYVGIVNLGCTITPAAAVPPTCALGGATVTLASNVDVQTQTITLGTKAASASLVNSAMLLLPIPGMALILASVTPGTRKRWVTGVFGLIALASLLLFAGCGSGNGGGGGGGGGGGTTAGSYTVNVTGAANGANTQGTATFSVQ